jgi:hypothetical protein
MKDGFETSSIGSWPGRLGLRAQTGAYLAMIESRGDFATVLQLLGPEHVFPSWRGQAYPSKLGKSYAHDFCTFLGELHNIGCGCSLVKRRAARQVVFESVCLLSTPRESWPAQLTTQQFRAISR